VHPVPRGGGRGALGNQYTQFERGGRARLVGDEASPGTHSGVGQGPGIGAVDFCCGGRERSYRGPAGPGRSRGKPQSPGHLSKAGPGQTPTGRFRQQPRQPGHVIPGRPDGRHRRRRGSFATVRHKIFLKPSPVGAPVEPQKNEKKGGEKTKNSSTTKKEILQRDLASVTRSHRHPAPAGQKTCQKTPHHRVQNRGPGRPRPGSSGRASPSYGPGPGISLRLHLPAAVKGAETAAPGLVAAPGRKGSAHPLGGQPPAGPSVRAERRAGQIGVVPGPG